MLLRSRLHASSSSSSSSTTRLISKTFTAMGVFSTVLFVAWTLLGLARARSVPRFEGGSGKGVMVGGSESGSGSGSGRGGNDDVSDGLQQVLRGAHQGKLFNYPTSFTQGIMPRPFHSHNDYWRPVPFYTALSYGAVSIEADVWLYNDTLYIGHHPSSLSAERTFASLYVNPILSVLAKQNPQSAFAQNTKNGVWDTANDQTLYLFVDVKTEGVATWKKVVEELAPLKKARYLSTADSKQFYPGAITIIGTGGTPFDAITSTTPRHYFYDGPLERLTTAPEFTSLVSPIASTDFEEVFGKITSMDGLNKTQVEILKTQVDAAHERGVKVRYWNQPDWPVGLRNRVWRQLVEGGVDLLNVDDLRAVSGVGAGGEW